MGYVNNGRASVYISLCLHLHGDILLLAWTHEFETKFGVLTNSGVKRRKHMQEKLEKKLHIVLNY